jgi:hypothetical protein
MVTIRQGKKTVQDSSRPRVKGGEDGKHLEIMKGEETL